MGTKLFKSKSSEVRERAHDVRLRFWGLTADCMRVLLFSKRPGARMARYMFVFLMLLLVVYFAGPRIVRWIEYLFALMGGFTDVPERGGL